LHARLAKTMSTVFTSVLPYTSYTPSYGRPWGFILGRNQVIDTQPNPSEVDRLLAEKTTGGFRLMDGITLLGMLQTPAHIRKAIAAETEVYTMSAPPKFFGKGASS